MDHQLKPTTLNERFFELPNSLTALPDLPESLDTLWCDHNSISFLPVLPQLTGLRCASNDLAVLPELPESLIQLHCDNNILTGLPELPQTLRYLECENNTLTSLPELPGTLLQLRCENNQLMCLPTLPMSLTDFYTPGFNISNNPFTCLPNYVPAMSGVDNAIWLEIPLCDLADVNTNPYGCSSLAGIAGSVFNDTNIDCVQGIGELGIGNVPMKLLDDQGNQLALTMTLGNTLYNFVAGEGDYRVELATSDMPFLVTCADPGAVQEIQLTPIEPSAIHVDFGVECRPGYDIGVQSVVNYGLVFPGQQHRLQISAGDMSSWYGLQCAAGVSGTVTVDINGPVSYLGPALGTVSPTQTGPLQFLYNIADFSLLDFEQDLRLVLETDPDAQSNDSVCVQVEVEPVANDYDPTNNTYYHCYYVVNSFDPNIKQVWPLDVQPAFDGYFTYTVFFQNTGNAPAFNIRLADTLDTNLDPNSFEVISYSHPVFTYLNGNGLTFRFNSIMLPDSASDPEGSIGYVQYRIKPMSGLVEGTMIENTAYIYFDFNEAIVTNTTRNNFVDFTSIMERSTFDLQVFPNPGNGSYQVMRRTPSGGPIHLKVFDVTGREVASHNTNGVLTILDLSAQPRGSYLLRAWNDSGIRLVKLVKQ